MYIHLNWVSWGTVFRFEQKRSSPDLPQIKPNVLFTELIAFSNCMTTAEAGVKLKEVTAQVKLVHFKFGENAKCRPVCTWLICVFKPIWIVELLDCLWRRQVYTSDTMWIVNKTIAHVCTMKTCLVLRYLQLYFYQNAWSLPFSV